MEIKEIRRQTMLSQTEFSKELGIPVGTVRNWEQNRAKPPRYVEKLIEENLISKGYVISENRADSIDDIKSIVIPIAKEYGLTKVVLFGSRARGDYNGKSDYDFYVECKQAMGLKYFGMIEDVKKALSSPVDVVSDISEKSLYLREAIEKDGVLIYAG